MGNAKVLTLCLDDWEYLLTHFPKSKVSIFEEFTKKYFKDDDKPPDKDRKRLQIPKHPGRVRDMALKIGSDSSKRFISVPMLRRKSKSNSSSFFPIPSRTRPVTSSNQLTKESLTELLPALSRVEATSSIFDIEQMSKRFPTENRTEFNSVDLTIFKEKEQSHQSKKSILLPVTEEKHETAGKHKLLDKKRAEVAEFLGELAPSFEKFLQTAASHWDAITKATTSQKDDQVDMRGQEDGRYDNASGNVEPEIYKKVDDETKSTDEQSATSDKDEKREKHEKEDSKEERPPDSKENGNK